jgi:hypothetical protein
MVPTVKNKWLVIFCDEINLVPPAARWRAQRPIRVLTSPRVRTQPMNDTYMTQSVITFMRQVTEYGGFWRASDNQFIELERIQFIGACNPPTDPGRVALTPRFMRHCPVRRGRFCRCACAADLCATTTTGAVRGLPCRAFAAADLRHLQPRAAQVRLSRGTAFACLTGRRPPQAHPRAPRLPRGADPRHGGLLPAVAAPLHARHAGACRDVPSCATALTCAAAPLHLLAP